MLCINVQCWVFRVFNRALINDALWCAADVYGGHDYLRAEIEGWSKDAHRVMYIAEDLRTKAIVGFESIGWYVSPMTDLDLIVSLFWMFLAFFFSRKDTPFRSLLMRSNEYSHKNASA